MEWFLHGKKTGGFDAASFFDSLFLNLRELFVFAAAKPWKAFACIYWNIGSNTARPRGSSNFVSPG
jgi:hypothetical protein